jgi:DEK C terminal domain
LQVPQLKKLCDFFCVDRTDYNGKDSLVDALLDFLGEPDEEKMKGTLAQPKKGKKGKKGLAKKSEDAEDDDGEADNHGYDDVDDDKLTNPEFDSDGMPTDDTLRKWVRAYVRCHNMKTSSVKDALAIASAKFEKDISSQKARLKELLTEEI